MKTMDASKARQSLARVLESVRDGGESVVIVRYGQPMAALVPISHLAPGEQKSLRGRAGDHGVGAPRRR